MIRSELSPGVLCALSRCAFQPHRNTVAVVSGAALDLRRCLLSRSEKSPILPSPASMWGEIQMGLIRLRWRSPPRCVRRTQRCMRPPGGFLLDDVRAVCVAAHTKAWVHSAPAGDEKGAGRTRAHFERTTKQKVVEIMSWKSFTLRDKHRKRGGVLSCAPGIIRAAKEGSNRHSRALAHAHDHSLRAISTHSSEARTHAPYRTFIDTRVDTISSWDHRRSTTTTTATTSTCS